MEDLLSTQQQLLQAMEQLFTNFKKDGAERKTPSYISRRLETLDQYWKEFQANHVKLCEYEDQDYTYFLENHFEKAKSYYTDCRRIIQQHLSTDQEKKSVLRPATPLAGVTSDWRPPSTAATATPSGQASTSRVDRGNHSKLDEMYRKQKSNFKALERAINTTNLELLTEKWELEDSLRNLQLRWNAVDSLHWEIDSELTTEDVQYEKTYYMFEDSYKKIKKSINSKMWSVSHQEHSTPKMEIPTFSGNYQQWSSFKDLFMEMIHKNKFISNVQKMQHLKSKVKGEAEKLIQHLNISSENYETCWEILNHRYNNKRLIFSSHMNTLFGLPTIQHQSSFALKKLHDTTKECLSAVKNLGVNTSSWDPLVVHLLMQKLDTDTHNDYFEYLEHPRELPTLSGFLTFLEMRFTALESSRRKQEAPRSNQQATYQDSKKAQYSKAYPGASTKAFINHTNVKSLKSLARNKYTCPLCNEQHGIFHCKSFLGQTPELKRKTVAKLNLCENCLFDHKGKDCFSDKRCAHCKCGHNTLLHEAYVSNINASERDSNKRVTQQRNVTHVSQENVAEILLATAQIKVLSADGSYLTMRALIDQGSQTSLISENAAQRLGLPRQRCKGIIFGIGTKENNCKGIITITASSMNSEYTFNTDVIIMKSLVNNLPNRSFDKPSWKRLEGIQLADPDFNISRPIDILLGANIYSNIIMSGIIREDENQPIVQQSRLGWIICGNLKSYHCNVVLHDLQNIQRFWTIEDIADNKITISSEDQYCLEHYNNTTTRQEDGRYVVRLPMKPGFEEKLGDSKQKAVAQLYQLERKFAKNEDLAAMYKNFMREYIELEHMQQCTRNSNTIPATSCYLPHHCVQRAESLTTALRVVFNASSKTSSGYSLNDLMYNGPNLQADLLSLIISWRQYKVAFTADIEKMFRAILCNDNDKHLQKIIWRESSNQPLQEYELLTVTYGTKAAPFLAMNTLKQLARDEGQHFPEAAKVLKRDFFMDDVLSGQHSIPAALKLKTDLINLLRSGGFNLRRWCSNSNELLQAAASDTDSNHQIGFDFKQKESTKTLGLRWNPQKDVFTFELKINTSTDKPASKRSLLSDISKVFDPAGWLCPVTTRLKLLFQSVWKEDLKWDDQLPLSIEEEWSKIKHDLEGINQIQVPRWLQSYENDDIELHGFCDSSERAYACVIYSKIKSKKQGEQAVVLIAAKSKLVPTSKIISLPKLELCAAHLLSRLMQTVKHSLSDQNIKTFGWSDSTAVLGWIQGDINRWKPFVANRVQQIKEIIPADCWQYVKSTDNPADCASRGVSTAILKNHPLWWQGPSWLKTYQKETTTKTYTTDQEVKKAMQTNVTIQRHSSDVIEALINKHSCMTRVTRILTWVLRAVSNSKPRTPYLTAPEIKQAKYIIIKHIQEKYFYEEMLTIKKQGKVKRNSKLLSLNPFLDKNDLLRVGGRINNASIDENMKHPLIVPHSGHFTELIIDQAHKATFHGGARLTLSNLRQHYWIIGGNRAVKKRIRECVVCRRHNPIKQTQIMGDLPSARCNPTRPFYHVGTDYTGFIDVKANKGRGIKTAKGYVAVFVCMVTKAVHLEMVSDLSSSAFLAALRRMAARRGAPRHLYSDNGTNFVGANKHLQQEFINLRQTLDDDFFAAISDMEIEWHFNAPSWPSAGGLWEAAVKSLKFHLRRVIGAQKLTFEELSTLLSQLEACLNSRPLCALSEDPEDINFLTPSHFLASGPTLTIIETERDERTRWQLVQKIFYDIWKRWQSEYLCQLSARSKWQQKQRNMKIGDVVVIHDVNLPPGKWALARVVELHPGKDDLVRVVSLKTKNNIIKRPITKISPLLSDNYVGSEQNSESSNKESTAENTKAKRTRSKKSCNFIALAMLTLLTIISPVQCAFNLLSLSNNQSIYLDKISNMHLVRDQWKLIVYYEMNPYWQGIELFRKYFDYLDNICSKISKQTKCDVMLSQLRHEATELDYYHHMLLGQQYTRSRRRRGLINGVGYLAHSLFGVLDDEFAQKYERDINLIRMNQKHLALLWKNQTSVVEAEYNLLSRIEESINKQYKIFNAHIIELEKEANIITKEIQTEKIINEFILSSMIANNILANLKNIQETLVETITDIHYGQFNVYLLTPEQLSEELNIISGQLSKELALPINNIQNNLSRLYHLLEVKARMTSQYFIFEIKIPLVSRDTYEIYRLISIPQQVQKQMVRITPIADHIAINIQKDSYVPLSEEEVRRCTQFNAETHLCPLQKPIFHMNSDDILCIKNEDTGQCEIKTSPCKDIWVELNKLNTYLYFCCNQRMIRIICEHHVTAQRLSKAGIIILEDGCFIKSETLTIFSHRKQVTNYNIKPDLAKIDIPPINDVINLSIPLQRLEKFDESENEENRKHLSSIGHQIEQLKTSDADTEMANQLSNHDLHQYVLIYLLLGAAILASTLFALRSLRRRCTARIQRPSQSERSAGLNIQFTGTSRNTEQATSVEPRGIAVTSSGELSARALDKSTSPTVCKRFSDLSAV